MGYTDSDGAHLDSADIERARKCSTDQGCGTLLEGSPCPEHEARCSFCGRVDLRENMVDLKAGEWACDIAACRPSPRAPSLDFVMIASTTRGGGISWRLSPGDASASPGLAKVTT